MKRKKENILITCAGGSSSIYFAQAMSRRHNIFLVDADDRSVAPYLGLPFMKIPFGKSLQFIKVMDQLIRKWKITCIVPGADEELVKISRYVRRTPGVTAVVPQEKFISQCLDKKGLMKLLHEYGISELMPWSRINDVKYPAAVKPNYARGSRGFHVVTTRKQLIGYIDLYKVKFADLVVQPYIEGTEFTVSVIVNNKNKLIGIVPKRIIIKRGITKASVVEKNITIERVCRQIVSQLKPRGIFNVQLKLLKGKIYIFEINPRLSTTAVQTAVAFGNEIELHLKYHDKDTLRGLPKMKTGIYLYRYDRNYFRKKNRALNKIT